MRSQLRADGRAGECDALNKCNPVILFFFFAVVFFFSCFVVLLLFPPRPPLHPSLPPQVKLFGRHGLAVHQQSVLPRSLLEPVRQIGPVRPAHHPELLGHRRAGGPLRHQTGRRLRAPTGEQLLDPGPACRRSPAGARGRPRAPQIVQSAPGAQLQAPGGLPPARRALPQRHPVQAGFQTVAHPQEGELPLDQ